MTWWKRKSRFNRALWRHGIYWPAFTVMWLLVFYFWDTIYVLVALAPFIGWRIWKRVRFLIRKPIRVNGQVQWIWHPRFKRIFKPKYRPGYHANTGANYDEPPIEVQQAIAAQVEADEQDAGHPFAIPFKRMRRLSK